jgi:hypothetical protein
MGRLVTFGCSLTFGLALPDTWPYTEKYVASNLAWPNVLANKLNLETINKGIPAAGQNEILNAVLNFDFNDDDTCVIMWSYFDRLDFYKFTEPNIGNRIETNHKSYRNILMMTDIYQTDVARRNWLTIQHCVLYLRNKRINTVSIVCLDDKVRHPNTIYKIDVSDTIQDITWNYLDKAIDKVHPGVESHKNMADQIYNKVFNVVY